MLRIGLHRIGHDLMSEFGKWSIVLKWKVFSLTAHENCGV
jgi:hypothetical protein